MKALVFHGPRDARMEEVPDPVAGPGEVVCTVGVVGVCATDIEVYTGVMLYFRLGMLAYPWIGGHEWAGVVETVGDGVTDFKPGDRVVSEVTVACGKCPACRAGRPQMCWPRTEIGVTGKYQGAFAQKILVPAGQLYKLPDEVSLKEAAMTEPAGVGLHGIDIMRIDGGERVLVIGDGPIGVLAAQLAKAEGASPVVLLGSREHKMQAALDTGVDAVVSRHDADAVEQVLGALGGSPADSLIETSGNAKVFESITRMVRNGGKMLLLSLYGVPTVPVDLDYLVGNEIQVFTSLAASNTFPRVLRLMQSKQIQTLPLQAHYPFERIAEAIEDVANKKMPGVKTLVVNEAVGN